MPEFIHTGKDKKKFVKKMFDDISSNYDMLNRILSFGIDKSWRKKLIKSMDIISGQYILDVATGTGRTLQQIRGALTNVELLGIDLSGAYLRQANHTF